MGDQGQTKCLISHGVIPQLAKLIEHSKKTIRRNTAWALSNMAAEPPEEIQCLIDAGVFPLLFARISREEFTVQKEILWTCHNALSGGNDNQIQYLIEEGVIPCVCEMATAAVDEAVITVALDDVCLVLEWGERVGRLGDTMDLVESCGGLEKLEDLTGHPSDEVYQMAYRLVERYFGIDYDAEQDSLMDEQAMDLSKDEETSDQVL